jgi:hypothetical protein
MNILFDIFNLLRNKQVIRELKSDDLIVIGRQEESQITGVSSPTPTKTVKVIKAVDFQGKAENVGTGVGLFKEKISNILKFKSIKSSDLSVSITEEEDEINLTVPSSGIGGIPYHGSFYSLIDQQASVPNVTQAVVFEETDISYGVSIQNDINGFPSQIKFDFAGTYNIQFSGQLHHRGGGGSGEKIFMWFRQNDIDIPNSNIKLTVPNGKFVVAARNIFVKVLPNDYVQLVVYPDNASIALEHLDATLTQPAIPSVILTVNKIA